MELSSRNNAYPLKAVSIEWVVGPGGALAPLFIRIQLTLQSL